MNIFKPSLKKAFREMERTLTKNIANDLFDITVHQYMSDDELRLFYGGGVDREAMLTDTRRKLDGDQRLLRFYQDHKEIFESYGDQDATADLSGITQRDSVQAPGSDSHAPGTEEDGGEGSGTSSEGGDGHQDDAAPADTDRGNGDQEHGSGGEPTELAGGTRRDDSGGEQAGAEDTGGEALTILTLPRESEERRLKLEEISKAGGTIVKIDGDEAHIQFPTDSTEE